MTKQTTPKRPKADPHEVARSIVRKHLEGIFFAETELTGRHNRLHEAIRASNRRGKVMSQKQHDALEARFRATLPPTLKANYDRLSNGWCDLMAVSEEAAFLVGLYAGRGGAR